jgi:hypothetical protein
VDEEHLDLPFAAPPRHDAPGRADRRRHRV